MILVCGGVLVQGGTDMADSDDSADMTDAVDGHDGRYARALDVTSLSY